MANLFTREWLEFYKRRRAAEKSFEQEMDARVAQLAEQPPCKRQVDGSIPVRGHRVHPHVAGRIYPLVLLCEANGLPLPVPEYEFHPGRRWRFDYCWPQHIVAVEIDGGVWTQGRHTRGQGFIEDQRKLNAAAKLGWRILRYTPDRLGEAIEDLTQILR